MKSIKMISSALMAVLLVVGCNTNDDDPNNENGSANILEHDREILDNRDDGIGNTEEDDEESGY